MTRSGAVQVGLVDRRRALKVPGTVMERLDLSLDDVRSLHEALTPLIARSRAAQLGPA